MKKPDFICIGAQKAGTTSLQDVLSKHPDVYLSPLKEIKFFHRDEHYRKGMDWYLNHFIEAKDSQIIGDITPDYILYNSSAKRIHETLGKDVKIIVLLRNPVDRAYSQFNFHQAAKVESETDFKNVIDNYGNIDKENRKFVNWYTPPYYLERGLYYNQLARYYSLFPKENIHIAIFEELFGKDSEKEFDKLYKFLKIEPLDNNNIHSHSTRIPKKSLTTTFFSFFKSVKELVKWIVPKEKYKQIRSDVLKMTTQKPKKLAIDYKKHIMNTFFLEDIELLEKLIERDLTIWKQ